MDQLAAALDLLGLGRYAEAFRAADVDFDTLKLLTEEDLKEIGLSLGHRRKLLTAIAQGDLLPPKAAPLQHTAEPERRQITVMLCDMVGSTELTQRLDPEEMGRIIRQFQRSAAAAISRFDGFLDRFLGDGVLAFFGYPHAHEDAAERAVRSALMVLDSIRDIATSAGEQISVRIAIASGSALFEGTVEYGAVREPVVISEVVNLAARLQPVAPLNGVVVSPQTRRLLRELFILDDLGPYDLKGIARPTRVWRVLRERRAGTRFEAARGHTLSPVVGRDAEITLLMERWRSVHEGEGQVVLLSGDAGMGKSRIAQVLCSHLEDDKHLILRYQCSPYHRNSALHPVITQLQHAARIRPEDSPETRLEKVQAVAEPGSSAEVIVLFADLLSIPLTSRYASLDLSPEEHKRKTLQMLVGQLLALARRQPVFMLFEDAHWIDPTTQELLSQCITHIQNAAVLLLVTYRPEFQPDWANLPHVTNLALSGLPRRHALTILEHVAGGKQLPAELVNQIVARTDGIPLFVEELSKAILELGILRDKGDRYELLSPLPTLSIPDTLHNSLLARLDRNRFTKEVAQVGAVIGREFAFPHLSALAPVKGDALHAALADLLRAELIHQRGSMRENTYAFKHALIQEAAYSTLVGARRQQLHAQCAAMLRELSADIEQQQPELLAHHYTQAGDTEEAITCWLRAGRRAAERSANVEAVAHLRHGLQLVPSLADPARRSEVELHFHLEMGGPLIATEGYAAPATLASWERARALAEQRGEHRQLARTLYGLWAARVSLGETRVALGIADRILEIGTRIGDDGVQIVGHRVHALTMHALGHYAAARAEFEDVLALPLERYSGLRFEFGQDPRIAATAIFSNVLWGMGYTDLAARTSLQNVEQAAELGHVNSLFYALAYGACLVAMLRGDTEQATRLAGQLLQVAAAYHSPFWEAYGKVYKGWALARQGEAQTAVALLRSASEGFKEAGSGLYVPLTLGVSAYVLARAGRHEEARARVDEAVTEAEQREETWSLPELLRQKARILQRLGQPDTGVVLLDRAFNLARAHGMHSWELRVACDLVEFRRAKGERDHAASVLQQVLDCFPEQADTPDRRRALALLDAANRAPSGRDHRMAEGCR